MQIRIHIPSRVGIQRAVLHPEVQRLRRIADVSCCSREFEILRVERCVPGSDDASAFVLDLDSSADVPDLPIQIDVGPQIVVDAQDGGLRGPDERLVVMIVAGQEEEDRVVR